MNQRTGTVAVVGTGGTIAGRVRVGRASTDVLSYDSGALGAADLVAAVPALQGQALAVHNVAQIDSCDMGVPTWQALARTLLALLADAQVAGIVVTHGTDTLEETATFLHEAVDASTKPVVLTAAMRPASAASPDGPQNLLDAVVLARDAAASGVLATLGGAVWAGSEVRKVHGHALAAFSAGDAGPLALVENGLVRWFRSVPRPAVPPLPPAVWGADPAAWPWVEVLTSHAGARGTVVDLLVAAGVHGLVVAGTGNGSLHAELRTACQRAQAAGVVVWRASRCVAGGVVGDPSSAGADTLPSAGPLTPAQARAALVLHLLRERAARAG